MSSPRSPRTGTDHDPVPSPVLRARTCALPGTWWRAEEGRVGSYKGARVTYVTDAGYDGLVLLWIPRTRARGGRPSLPTTNDLTGSAVARRSIAIALYWRSAEAALAPTPAPYDDNMGSARRLPLLVLVPHGGGGASGRSRYKYRGLPPPPTRARLPQPDQTRRSKTPGREAPPRSIAR